MVDPLRVLFLPHLTPVRSVVLQQVVKLCRIEHVMCQLIALVKANPGHQTGLRVRCAPQGENYGAEARFCA